MPEYLVHEEAFIVL